jgi:phosphatidate cytidylyltransferase
MTRLIVGWLLIFFFFGILYGGHLYCVLMCLVTQVLMFRELANVRYSSEQAREVPMFRTIQWLYFFTAVMFFYGEGVIDFFGKAQEPPLSYVADFFEWVCFASYIVLFVGTVLSLKKGYYKYQMGQLTWTILIIAMIVVQMSNFNNNIYTGLFWFIFPASLVVVNDSFAYFVGFFVGRKLIHKPFLTLSPKKTWYV